MAEEGPRPGLLGPPSYRTASVVPRREGQAGASLLRGTRGHRMLGRSIYQLWDMEGKAGVCGWPASR